MKKNAIFIYLRLSGDYLTNVLHTPCSLFHLLSSILKISFIIMAFLVDLYVQKERKNKTLCHFGDPLPFPLLLKMYRQNHIFLMTSMFFLTKPPKSQIPVNSPQLKGSESREVETSCLSWCLINVPTMCSTCSLEVAGNLRDIRIATELREMWVKVCRRRETSPN